MFFFSLFNQRTDLVDWIDFSMTLLEQFAFDLIGLIRICKKKISIDIRDDFLIGYRRKTRICTHDFIQLIELFISHRCFAWIDLIRWWFNQRFRLNKNDDEHQQTKTIDMNQGDHLIEFVDKQNYKY